MREAEYRVMFEAEDRHWWYQGMAHLSRALLQRHLPVGRGPLRVLDAGCGTGLTLEWLGRYGEACGIDFSAHAVRFCRERGLRRLARASILELPFDEASFDLATSFDVLSEVGHPGFLQGFAELHRVLRPGGLLLLRLPAYRWLFSRHDRAVDTRYRFSRGELRRLLVDAGFEVVHSTYANTLLFPVAVAKRLLDRLAGGEPTHSDVVVPARPINAAFRTALSLETPLARTVGLPFGLTVVALGRRPERA